MLNLKLRFIHTSLRNNLYTPFTDSLLFLRRSSRDPRSTIFSPKKHSRNDRFARFEYFQIFHNLQTLAIRNINAILYRIFREGSTHEGERGIDFFFLTIETYRN